jgi:branched-chain amino acid transport system substrate-binding protein
MVVPRPNATGFSVVSRCQQDLAALGGGAKMGMTTLEGYIAGRIAVEAAQNVMKVGAVTRPRMREALATLRADVGGYKVEFGGGTQGSKYVDLVAIDRYGRMVG